MRKSPLLRTLPANLLFGLIAVGVAVWTCSVLSRQIEGMETADITGWVFASSLNAILAGIVGLLVMIVGPYAVRFILSKRLYIVLAVICCVLIDPALAVVAFVATVVALGITKACYSGIAASAASLFNHSHIAWPLRIIYTFAGAVLVLAIATTPHLSIDWVSFLPWPLGSVLGLSTVFIGLVISGYVVGNLYFPLITARVWSVLAFLVSLVVLNPVLGLALVFLMVALFFVVLWLQSNGTGESSPHNYSSMHNGLANRYVTPGTGESESIDMFTPRK